MSLSKKILEISYMINIEIWFRKSFWAARISSYLCSFQASRPPKQWNFLNFTPSSR